MSEAQESAPATAPDQYIIEARLTFNDTQPTKDGKGVVTSTKMVNSMVGPFADRPEAIMVLCQLLQKPNFISGVIKMLVDGPPPEQQVPPSEDVVREMLKNAGRPAGVPEDVAVRVEGAEPAPEPGNTIPFPAPSSAATLAEPPAQE